MLMSRMIVIDTVSLISYFSSVFNRSPRISERALALLDRAFTYPDEILLSIPGVVFVEIFDKWFRGDTAKDEEFRAKFRAEVLERIIRAPNIEIREIDIETLEMFLSLEDPTINLENNDRLILATAAVLQARLVTSDAKVVDFVEKNATIPATIR